MEREGLGKGEVGTVGGLSWQKRVKHIFSSRCQSWWKLYSCSWGEVWGRSPSLHSGFYRLNGYHSSGHLIAFPPTGNGRKSLFLLLLPMKRGGRKGQESVRDTSAPGCCSVDTNCTTVLLKLCALLLWEDAEAKSLAALAHRLNPWVAKQDLSCQVRLVVCFIQSLIMATFIEAGF